MDKPFEVKRGANTYKEGQKCPACSSEVDKGGKLELHKKKNKYLKCNHCGYSMLPERVLLSRIGRASKVRSRAFDRRAKI